MVIPKSASPDQSRPMASAIGSPSVETVPLAILNDGRKRDEISVWRTWRYLYNEWSIFPPLVKQTLPFRRDEQQIATLVKNVRWEEETTDNFDRFMDLLRRYVGVGIEELTPTMINEFVKKIIVHEADNSTGNHVQQVEIIFNFIGDLDLPAVNKPITVTKGFNEKPRDRNRSRGDSENRFFIRIYPPDSFPGAPNPLKTRTEALLLCLFPASSDLLAFPEMKKRPLSQFAA